MKDFIKNFISYTINEDNDSNGSNLLNIDIVKKCLMDKNPILATKVKIIEAGKDNNKPEMGFVIIDCDGYGFRIYENRLTKKEQFLIFAIKAFEPNNTFRESKNYIITKYNFGQFLDKFVKATDLADFGQEITGTINISK